MGPVIAVDASTERPSPGGIMKADTIGGFIRHPVVDKGIVLDHGMIGGFVGNLIDSGRGCMSCGHISCYAVGLDPYLIVDDYIDSLSGEVDIDIIILDDIPPGTIKEVGHIIRFTGGFLPGFDILDQILLFVWHIYHSVTIAVRHINLTDALLIFTNL